MISQEPKVFIIIVNYNGWQDTLACLDSLNKLNYANFKVVIIDNGSTDESAIKIDEYITCLISHRHHLLINPKNNGFAGGNNIGIEFALSKKTDYVLLLNNDTIVEPNFLQTLIKTAESNKQIGIIGPQINYFDQPNKIWFAGGSFSWFGGGKHIGIDKIEKETDSKLPKETGYITGCALLIKSEVIKKIGFMESEFFLYYEDTDWNISAKKAGYKIIYCPQAKIWHKVSQSSKKLTDPIIHYYHIRNALLLSSRHAPVLIKQLIYIWSGLHYIKQNIKIILLPKTTSTSQMIKAGILSFWQSKFSQYPGRKIMRVAIEGYELEKNNKAGVARILSEELKVISKLPKFQQDFKIYLYFKAIIPQDEYLQTPIFTKKIVKLPLIRPSFLLYYNFLLPLQIWRDKISVSYFPSYMVPLFCPSKKIISIHDVVFEAHPEWFRYIYRYGYRFLTYYGAIFSKKILTISEFSKKEIIKYYHVPKDKIVVSYLSANENFHQITDIEKINQAKKAIGLVNDYILFTAQIFNRRHAQECIESFGMIAQDFPDIQFLVSGKNLTYPYQDLKKLVKQVNEMHKREAVILIDYIVGDDNFIALQSAAKLFVYVSSYEGFGLPPLEAIVCKTPVVLADNEVSQEVFKDGAFYVKNPENPTEIANVLRTALSNDILRQEIIEKGQKILSNYSWLTRGKAVASVIEEVAKS